MAHYSEVSDPRAFLETGLLSDISCSIEILLELLKVAHYNEVSEPPAFFETGLLSDMLSPIAALEKVLFYSQCTKET